MIRFGWRVGLSCCAFGWLVGDAIAQNPTFSLIPTAASTRKCVGGPEDGQACGDTADCERNAQGAVYTDCQRVCGPGGDDEGQPCTSRFDCQTGTCIQRCSCNYWVQATPNTFLVAEIFGSNWSPNNQSIEGWQAKIDLNSACSAVRPFGWDRPCGADVECTDNTDCSAPFPVCGALSGFCEGPTHAPDNFSFICEPGNAPCASRADYVFFGRQELQAVDVSTLGFRYASALLQPPGPVFSTQKYFGTLSLRIQPAPDGCGTVTIGLSSPVESFMLDSNRLDIEPLDLEGLTIVLPPCVPTGILASDPANCVIDGRQDSEPDGSSPAGWTSIAVKLLDNDQTVGFVTTSDFNLREVPGGATFNPDTVSADDPALGWATLTFPPSTPGAWTCVRYRLFTDEVCLGSQPGDADGNRTSEAVDLTRLTDCITGAVTVPCELRECDMDRSGTCAGADLLRAVDLLGGAQSYSPGWLGTSLPVCPSGP